MPGWLLWTLVGLASWFTVSVALAFLVGHLLQRAAELPRRRVVVLAGPVSVRVRVRRGLRRVS